jgi:HK97 gp10 family phage protein
MCGENVTVRITINVSENADLNYVQELVDELPSYLENYLRQRLLEVAKDIAAQAQSEAPVKTGLLQSMIYAFLEANNNIGIMCEVPYAKFQEFGTKFILPKMFMNRAMQDHYDAIRQTIVDVIQEYFQTVVA